MYVPKPCLIGLALVAALCVGCLGRYYGESSLTDPARVSLEVVPLQQQRTSTMPARFSLVSGLTKSQSFCVGLPWIVSTAWEDGTTQEFEVFASSEEFCESEIVTIEPGENAIWTDTFLYRLQESKLLGLNITVRVYVFEPNGKPRRKKFYTLSSQWEHDA